MIKISLIHLLLFSTVALHGCSQQKKVNESFENSPSKPEQNNIAKKVSTTEFDQLIKENPGTIVDVRTPQELKNGYIDGAINIDFNADGFEEQLLKVDKDQPIYVYCHIGGRSRPAFDILVQNGYKEVYELQGGMTAWNKASLPTLTGEQQPLLAASENELNEYNSAIMSADKVCVNFYATWCGVCKNNRPVIKKYCEENEIMYKEYDVDQYPGLKNSLEVNVVPTLIVYKNGKVSWEKEGLIKEEELKNNL